MNRHMADTNDEAVVERQLEIQSAREAIPEQWLEAFLNPECFYCGRGLSDDEYDVTELPHERICQRCYEKEADEIDGL